MKPKADEARSNLVFGFRLRGKWHVYAILIGANLIACALFYGWTMLPEPLKTRTLIASLITAGCASIYFALLLARRALGFWTQSVPFCLALLGIAGSMIYVGGGMIVAAAILNGW